MAEVFCLKNLTEKEREQAVQRAAECLSNGGLVIFPTETVYGIGCDACNPKAVQLLYEKKQRPLSKPLLLHLADLRQAEKAAFLTDSIRKVLAVFTPGPLSVIAKKKEIVSNLVSSGGDTVGLRFPDQQTFLDVAHSFDGLIAATSANISGFDSAKNGEDLESLYSLADVILDDGPCRFSFESTIVSMTAEKPKILRQGALSRAQLEEVIGPCD